MGLYIFTLASPTLMSNSEVQWCGKGQYLILSTIS